MPTLLILRVEEADEGLRCFFAPGLFIVVKDDGNEDAAFVRSQLGRVFSIGVPDNVRVMRDERTEGNGERVKPT